MIAVPAFIPVTKPFLSTLAIFVFELFQDTLLFDVVIVKLSPTVTFLFNTDNLSVSCVTVFAILSDTYVT